MIRSALKTTGIVTLLGVATLALTSHSQAAFKLFLDDLGDASPGITITDEDLIGPPADGAPFVPGLVSYDSGISGDIGGFTVVVSTGISKPLIGPPDSIDLVHLQIDGGSGGTLLIRTTDTDYTTLTGGAADFTGSISGTTSGTVSATAFADDANTEFGGAVVGSLGPFVGPSFSDAFLSTDSPYTSPFSMTLEALVTHDSAFDTTSFDFLLTVEGSAGEDPVPEPATWLLGSMALIGLGLGFRRKLR